jgi:hypothetical protein
MQNPSAEASAQFRVLEQLPVHRLGFDSVERLLHADSIERLAVV